MKTRTVILLLAALSKGFASAATPSDLLLYYSGDRMDGVVVPDEGPGGHSALVKGYPGSVAVHVDPQRGRCLAFNGGALDVGEASFVEGQTNLSFGAWIKPAVSQLGGIIGKCESRDVTLLLNIGTPRNLHAAVDQPGNAICATNDGRIQIGEWQHVMATFDGKSIRLYHNGLLVAITHAPAPSTTHPNDINLCIGDSSLRRGWRFRGLMDDIRIYRQCLSPAEISDIISAAQPPGWMPPVKPQTLGPCYMVHDGKIYERALSATGFVERPLTADECRALLIGSGAGAGVAASASPICKIGFSNRPDGDRNMTVFLPSEDIHIWVTDVDMPKGDTNCAVSAYLSQQAATTENQPAKSLITLTQGDDGAFYGKASMADFRPGVLYISIVATSGSEPLLMRTSKLGVLDPAQN